MAFHSDAHLMLAHEAAPGAYQAAGP
jgi:hypothetical protein